MKRKILEVTGLNKHFGGLHAVKEFDLDLFEGDRSAIIGPNGAGKTTLFNLLTGYHRVDSGRIIFDKADITNRPSHEIACAGISRAFQITNIFPNLTVYENVRLASQALGGDNFKFWQTSSAFKEYDERTWEVLERVGLKDRTFALARTLPHGDQRKLELGIILAPDPEVLLLDEPTAGMAAEQVPELISLIQEIQQAGDKTVMLVEHNMNVVMSVSDLITVMHQGRVLAEGTPSEIAANEEVQTAYLGGLYELNV